MDQVIHALNPMLLFLIAVLLIGDALLGAARALVAGEFRLQKLGDAFIHKAVPYGIALFVLKAIDISAEGSAYAAWATTAFNTTWGFIAVSLIGSIGENVAAITGRQFTILPPESPGPTQPAPPA